MSAITEEIEQIKHSIMLGRSTPALQERLEALILDNAASFREEMAILARFEEAMREHPKEYAETSEPRRCSRCSRLLEIDWRPNLCRGCKADENSDIRDDMYRGL